MNTSFVPVGTYYPLSSLAEKLQVSIEEAAARCKNFSDSKGAELFVVNEEVQVSVLSRVALLVMHEHGKLSDAALVQRLSWLHVRQKDCVQAEITALSDEIDARQQKIAELEDVLSEMAKDPASMPFFLLNPERDKEAFSGERIRPTIHHLRGRYVPHRRNAV